MGRSICSIHGLFRYEASRDGTLIQRIEELCGSEAAVLVMANYGGRKLYIPQDPKPHHALCRLIGVENARRVNNETEFGGQSFEVPFGAAGLRNQKHVEVHRMVCDGKTTGEIAKALNCTPRSVRMIKSGLRDRRLID